MGSFSDYLENELLDHIFNSSYSPLATVYLGLSTADPLDDAGGLAEPSGNGYVRKAIGFSAASSRKVIQNGVVQYDQASGAWGTLTHWAIFDAESGGNMLAHGALSTSKAVVSGNTPRVADAEAEVEVIAGYVSDYLANALLDFAFRNQSFSSPDTYVALCTAAVADDDTGSTITEPSGNGYAREQVNPDGGASPAWDLASGGALDNAHDIDFTDPTGPWGTTTALAIADALINGNLLMYDNSPSDDFPDSGDEVTIAAGALDVSLS